MDVADLVRAGRRTRLVILARWGARGLQRVARSPLVHFVVLGGVLLAIRHQPLVGEPAGATPAVREPIVISSERVRELSDEFTGRWDRSPSAAEERALAEQAALDEMLFREARRLALDHGDGSVRRRLVEKMRLVGDRPGRGEDELVQEASELGLEDDAVIRRLLIEKMRVVLRQEDDTRPIADTELAAHLERHRDAFAQPERITFTQVFLAADTRGARLAADARATLVRLRTDGFAPELSDPSPLGTHLAAVPRPQLVGRFGKRFADEIMRVDLGAWSGPFASPYGLHLVRVEERRPARLPPLDEVRPALTRAVLRERGQQSLARGFARLRELYPVRIEPADQRAAVVPAEESPS